MQMQWSSPANRSGTSKYRCRRVATRAQHRAHPRSPLLRSNAMHLQLLHRDECVV